MPPTPRVRVRHLVSLIRRASTARQTPPITPYRPLANSPAPAPPSSQHPLPPKVKAKVRSPLLFWGITSIFAAGAGLYSVQIYLAVSKPCQNPGIADLAQQKDVAARFDDTASKYDSDVNWSEFIMGLQSIRRKLTKKCHGHVLEVSCGTGRNLGYFDLLDDARKGKRSTVESLTLVDLSPQMIDECKKKWDALMSRKKDRLRPGLAVRFLTGSALAAMPPAPGPGNGKYDTIIQTMGLCSTPSPAALLANIAAHLDLSKPESRVLLLEHGRSYKPWLNTVLDNAAEKHAEIHGCWFNRDIGLLVEEAARQTGLEVVRERRHHLGTTWVFELKPSAETVEKRAAAVEKGEEPLESAGGWRAWFGGR